MRAVNCCQVAAKGPKVGPYVAPRFPSLLTPGKERTRRLDWKIRSELASGKPQSVGSYFPMAEGLSDCKGVESPMAIHGQRTLCSQPNQRGWVLVRRIFCSALDFPVHCILIVNKHPPCYIQSTGQNKPYSHF